MNISYLHIFSGLCPLQYEKLFMVKTCDNYKLVKKTLVINKLMRLIPCGV